MALISFSFFLFHSEVIFTRLKISPMAEKRTSLDFGLNIYFFTVLVGDVPSDLIKMKPVEFCGSKATFSRIVLKGKPESPY